MRLLLDTCVAVWMFEGASSLPESVRQALTDPGNDAYFSDVSLLEIEIKYSIGKFPLDAPPSRSILPLVRKHALDILPLSTRDIVTIESLPLLHRDPFDRLLVAQALANGLTLVTPDPLIRQYDVQSLWRSATR